MREQGLYQQGAFWYSTKFDQRINITGEYAKSNDTSGRRNMCLDVHNKIKQPWHSLVAQYSWACSLARSPKC
jgi:hypothetical protein